MYKPLVHRICYRYTKNREESDDLTQDVFLKIFSVYGGFEGNSQPSTWLYRVTTNHCLDYLRWKKRQAEILSGYGDELLSQKNSLVALESPLKRLLNRLMDEMDDVNKQVVFLRFDVGLTHDEIADVCGVSRVAITKRLAKFKARLISMKAELTESMEMVSSNSAGTPTSCEGAAEESD